jgi:hypothetical protein
MNLPEFIERLDKLMVIAEKESKVTTDDRAASFWSRIGSDLHAIQSQYYGWIRFHTDA